MKVETNHKTDFSPIELKITIESKAELAALISHLNVNTTMVNDRKPNWINEIIQSEDTSELWSKLKVIYQSC